LALDNPYLVRNKEETAVSLSQAWCSRRAVAVLLTLTPSCAALASQGPGVGAGTASALTQTLMAIVIYGGVALILAAGIVRALRRRLQK
jgi:hypothetical protein